MEKALLTKSDRWAYEDEYRLLRYKDGPGLVEFRPHNLTGIIVGANAEDATIDLIKGWISNRVEPVTLYRAQVSSTEFEMEIGTIR